MSEAPGRLVGVGLGPGDPELVTLKAVRELREAAVVAWFCRKDRAGHARTIAAGLMPPGCIELPLPYPVTTEIAVGDAAYAERLRPFYENAAATLRGHLDAGRRVALLCEGDPLFYGSFMHLYVRLRERYDVTIVPGVSGMAGCWSAAGLPMTWGDDVLCVVPGTLPYPRLCEHLRAGDAAAIMKIGGNFAKVRAAVEACGLLDQAVYVERGTMAGERVLTLRDKHDDAAPYFSVILLPGHGRRP